MTLLSGSPLNVRLFNFQPGNAQLDLDYVFARCQAGPSCHQAFLHLAADWSALWASVGKSPWVIPAAQSPTKTTVRLDRDALASLAAAKNKVAALASVISALQASGQASAGASGGVNQMMLFEIQCSALANRPARGAVGSARQLSPTRPTWSRPS